MIDPLLVKVRPKVLPVPIDQLYARECSIATRVQICKHLLELNGIVHVEEVLDQVAKGSLLCGVLRRKSSQISQGSGDILASLVRGCAIVFFLNAAGHFKPRVHEGFTSAETVFFFAEDA